MFVHLVAMFLFLQAPTPTPAPAAGPQGRPAEGKTFIEGTSLSPCVGCHGRQGEGGYGPDLAGRGLNFEQFRRAVRTPWGVMPAFSATQIDDQTLADLAAYFGSLPKVAAAKAVTFQGSSQELNSRSVWRVMVPAPLPVLPGASLGQQMTMRTAGCAQCHGPEMDNPRRWAGGAGGDYAWLQRIVYNEGGRSIEAIKDMGTYSRMRLPEPALREIWQYMNGELGLRAFLSASVDKGVAEGASVTYTVHVRNDGVAGRGLAAEGVSISLAVPPGATVVTHTGPGYQGLRAAAPADGRAVSWRVPRVAAGDDQTYTLTLTGTGAASGMGPASVVQWEKPAADARRAAAGDSIAVSLPRPTATQ